MTAPFCQRLSGGKKKNNVNLHEPRDNNKKPRRKTSNTQTAKQTNNENENEMKNENQ